MKITYPECQVEITAEEFITVIDHFTTKVTCNTEPIFEPGGFVPENPNEGRLVEGETVKKGVGLPEPVKKALKEKQTKKVDVLFDDYGWKTFNSVSEAAKAIHRRQDKPLQPCLVEQYDLQRASCALPCHGARTRNGTFPGQTSCLLCKKSRCAGRRRQLVHLRHRDPRSFPSWSHSRHGIIGLPQRKKGERPCRPLS